MEARETAGGGGQRPPGTACARAEGIGSLSTLMTLVECETSDQPKMKSCKNEAGWVVKKKKGGGILNNSH